MISNVTRSSFTRWKLPLPTRLPHWEIGSLLPSKQWMRFLFLPKGHHFSNFFCRLTWMLSVAHQTSWWTSQGPTKRRAQAMHFNHVIMFVVTYLLHTPHHLLKVTYSTPHPWCRGLGQSFIYLSRMISLNSARNRHLHSKDQYGNIPRSIWPSIVRTP